MPAMTVVMAVATSNLGTQADRPRLYADPDLLIGRLSRVDLRRKRRRLGAVRVNEVFRLQPPPDLFAAPLGGRRAYLARNRSGFWR